MTRSTILAAIVSSNSEQVPKNRLSEPPMKSGRAYRIFLEMRDHAHTLSDFLVPTLSIECEPCGRFGRYTIARPWKNMATPGSPSSCTSSPIAPRRAHSASMTGARSFTARTAGFHNESRLPQTATAGESV
jgi:hypothetical protein